MARGGVINGNTVRVKEHNMAFVYDSSQRGIAMGKTPRLEWMQTCSDL